jgi:AraC-like DNA-binding protein
MGVPSSSIVLAEPSTRAGPQEELDRILARLGPVADRLGSRAVVAQYEADIKDPGRTRAGTALEGTTGPLPRFLPVRDILGITFNVHEILPTEAVPDRHARSPRIPTDDNLTLALPHAPTLRAALDLIARYGDQAVPWFWRRIVRNGDTLHISYGPIVPLGRIEALATQIALSTIHRIVETFMGDRVREARVNFSAPPVSAPERIAKRFSCAITVGGSESFMAIPAEWEAHPSPYQDAELWAEGVARCEADIAALSDPPRVSRVRAHVIAMLDRGAVPTAPQTARELGLPARTLVRALAAEGQTHHGIVDVERRHRALRLLARRDLPINEIADLLGFSDQSSFGRKCRAWFDESPSCVRRRLTSGAVRLA